MNNICIRYRYILDGQPDIEFEFPLDARRIELDRVEIDDLPDWARLEFHQCPNCPLKPEQQSACPVAANLVSMVHAFGKLTSHDEVSVEVTTPERVISTHTTLQRGVSSLLGLVMATSPCPHTSYLKPMARFHLPFASDEETTYRATSMFLLAQYFVAKEDGEQDAGLEGLCQIYQSLQIINTALAARLRAASEKDAAVNAVVLLDLFAKNIPYSVEEALEEIEYLFSAYLNRS
jgi:hypothetical protein